jgi:hypothetical protein
MRTILSFNGFDMPNEAEVSKASVLRWRCGHGLFIAVLSPQSA